MRRTVMVHGLAVTSIGLAALVAACSSDDNASSTGKDAGADVATNDTGAGGDDGASEASLADASSDIHVNPDSGGMDGGMMDAGMDSTMDAPMDVAMDALMDSPPDSPADAVPVADSGPTGVLTLSLDPSIDIDGDTVKATTLTSVDLFDTTGAKLASATVVGGNAVISLAGIAEGDYFLKVNGDADDLVPTHVDNPAQNVDQRVGTMLRSSYIGPTNAPFYRINTYSAGQARSGVVKFSDGTVIAPIEQPYVFVTLSVPKIEFKVLGTAAPISSYTPSVNVHPGNYVPFDAWLINTNNLDHHGDMFNADGGAATCAMCHRSMDTKPASYSSTIFTNGWCFHCHYGTGGSDNGFVDPTR